MSEALPALAHDMIDVVKFRRDCLPGDNVAIFTPHNFRCPKCGLLLIYYATPTEGAAHCSGSCGEVARVRLGEEK